MQSPSIEQLSIDTIRTLAMDAVQAADSGHPGTPMGLAPVAYLIWQKYLRFDPGDPIWPNRDRFVLSAGHASMLLYALLHLSGVKAVNPDYEVLGNPSVSLDDIRNFRQLGSRTPGHPEYHWTSGVETTTGPLGQGAAASVGMAVSSRWLAAYFNRPGFEMFNFDVYALAGDGCMMEGITGEAASLAGHLKLSNLCWIYDNNKITIEGATDLAFTEDTATRFLGYGWNVLRVGDGNDLNMLSRALDIFHKTTHGPTLIIVDSHFKEGIGRRGAELAGAWYAGFEKYKADFPELADHLSRMQRRDLPDGWNKDIPSFPPDPKGDASRNTSGKVLNAIAKNVPWLIGGSADLAPSTKTRLTFSGAGDFSADYPGGRNFHFGVREHAMAAIVNGMSHCKIRSYGSTFLIFSDYARPAIRLGALMELPVIHIFTHDSIGVGEDGPTHQPVEHLVSLRAIPHLIVLRPADANEVAEAWRVIMQLRHQPAALILSRQNLPTLDRARYAPASGLASGAYVLADAGAGSPEIILIGTGSEVSLCVDAYECLKSEGVGARVVSMPSWELFEQQDQAYRESVLPPSMSARISVEQASTLGWDRYVGPRGISIGMETFGASAPLKELQKKFGFTVDRILEEASRLLGKTTAK